MEGRKQKKKKKKKKYDTVIKNLGLQISKQSFFSSITICAILLGS